MGGLLIRRLSQASLHLRKIEEIIILAPHDVGEFGQISDNRAIAILAIQADHGLTRLEGLGLQICADRFHRLPQFSSVIAVARTRRPRKRADPLMGMGLEYGGPRPNGFPSLTPEVARSTHLIQSTLCRWQFRGAGQGALASGLSRAIHIEDQPLRSLSVPQPSRFVLLLQRASDQVVEKHDAQRLDRSLDRKSTRLNSSHTVSSTPSLHDALPISAFLVGPTALPFCSPAPAGERPGRRETRCATPRPELRSEEHTSELQSHSELHSFPTRRSSDLCVPCRSHSPPVLFSCSSGRATRSSRNTMRNASTGA